MIESEIFKRYHVDFKKLKDYGFSKIEDRYVYSENFDNNSFRADIIIDKEGKIDSKVIDLDQDEEYVNIKIALQNGEFVNRVRNSYKEILINIREKCFVKDYFIFNQANRITEYIDKTYHDKPEFLWKKFTGYGVFRNKNNNKWYGIIMNIDKSKMKIGKGEVEILNVKLEKDHIEKLLKKKGFFEAYHMNSKDWISIILDDTLKDNEIISLLNESYNLIKAK